MIKSLGTSSIQKLCSSQIITDLATAVKELLENSLDAKATKIEVKLKKYGLEKITVIDNGSGISEQDFHNLCISHTTNKMENFTDLYSHQFQNSSANNFYGFRGEALSAFCCLSTHPLVVCTKHKQSARNANGFELTYDMNGHLQSQKMIAREKHGTTIIINHLFSSLPVRYKTLSKNIKKQYHQMLIVLKAYAMVRNDVQMVITNDGKSVLKTFANSMNIGMKKSSIQSVYGYKFAQSLIKIDNEKISNFVLDGFVSDKCSEESGRTKNDRQFLFVNKRPIDCLSILRTINKIYKENICKNKYPIIILNIIFDRNEEMHDDGAMFDVNIDPNKRRIIFRNEEQMIEKIAEYFETHVYDVQQLTYNHKSLSMLSYLTQTENPIKTQVCNESEVEIDVHLNSRKRKYSFILETKEEENRSDSEMVENLHKIKRRRLQENQQSFPMAKKEKHFVQEQIAFNVDRNSFFNAFEALQTIRKKECHLQSQEKSEMKISAKLEENDIESDEYLADTLSRVLNKNDCTRMSIIGQFNLGFIVCRKENELFIIDQHAADEKFRYEQLSKDFRFPTQKLLIGKLLNPYLSVHQLSCIEDERNRKVFEENGFLFDVRNEENDIYWTSCPTNTLTLAQSSNMRSFDIPDIVELCSLLSLKPHSFVRPSKALSIFASKACRTAIMIGQSLTQPQMREIVDHMPLLSHPWQCPHGRPTMRHLFDLNMLARYFAKKRKNHSSYEQFGVFSFD